MSKHARLALIAIVGFVGVAFAASRQSPFVTKVAQNDGNTIAPFAVSCSSTAWTALVASDYRTRRVTVQNLTGGQSVCLSTGTNSDICAAAVTSEGFRLISPATYDMYTEAPIYCRALDAQAAQVIYGIKYYDSGDSSSYE